MIKLKKIPLSRILKLDLRSLLEQIIIILDNYDLEAMHLQSVYEVLKKQEVKMQIINDPFGKHHLTDELTELHKKRLRYASLINMQVKALGKIDCEETQRLAKIASILTKEHLIYLGQKKLFEVRSKIDLFFERLELDFYSEYRAAFISLGLQPYLDELKKANADYYAVYTQRSLDIKNRPPTGDRVLEKETKQILQFFFDQINSYQKAFPEIDYVPLINDLNERLTRYSKSIKTRMATNKRRARKKALKEKRAAEENDSSEVKSKSNRDIKSVDNSNE